MDTISSYIDTILAEMKNNSAFAREKFRNLDKEHLNRKPDLERWSIAECIDHLIISNSYYLNALKGAALSTTYADKNEKPRHTLVGRLLIKGVAPNPKVKVKTSDVFLPHLSDREVSVIDQYIEQNKELAELMDKCRKVDINKIKMKSPVSNMLSYNITDVMRVIVDHDKRHLLQAEQVMTAAEFDKSPV